MRSDRLPQKGAYERAGWASRRRAERSAQEATPELCEEGYFTSIVPSFFVVSMVKFTWLSLSVGQEPGSTPPCSEHVVKTPVCALDGATA